MSLYKAVLRPLSGFASAMQSDTLWGQLAAIFLRHHSFAGQSTFEDVIEGAKSCKPPFVISAGLPSGYLPLPPLVPPTEADIKELMADPAFFTDAANQLVRLRDIRALAKRLGAQKYVRSDAFQNLNRNGWQMTDVMRDFSLDEDGSELFLSSSGDNYNVMHTAVDRVTGVALDNHLYERAEVVYKGNIDVYVDILTDGWSDIVKQGLEALAEDGFGAKVTSGKGQFELLSFAEVERPGNREDSSSSWRMSISSFVPLPSQISDWRAAGIIVKRGKLGPFINAPAGVVLKAWDKPWKKPLLMLAAGSIYAPRNAEEATGLAVEGLAPAFESAVQFAYALGFAINRPPSTKSDIHDH